jgi:hypothetical protein
MPAPGHRLALVQPAPRASACSPAALVRGAAAGQSERGLAGWRAIGRAPRRHTMAVGAVARLPGLAACRPQSALRRAPHARVRLAAHSSWTAQVPAAVRAGARGASGRGRATRCSGRPTSRAAVSRRPAAPVWPWRPRAYVRQSAAPRRRLRQKQSAVRGAWPESAPSPRPARAAAMDRLSMAVGACSERERRSAVAWRRKTVPGR